MQMVQGGWNLENLIVSGGFLQKKLDTRFGSRNTFFLGGYPQILPTFFYLWTETRTGGCGAGGWRRRRPGERGERGKTERRPRGTRGAAHLGRGETAR
jgi:hypothetical protein